MNYKHLLPRIASLLGLYLVTQLSQPLLLTAVELDKDAEKAWQQVVEASKPRSYPTEWQEQAPEQVAIEAFHKENGELTADAADLARQFYTAFPDHPKAADAKEKELEMLNVAVQLGNTSVMTRLQTLELAAASDPSKSERERFELRLNAVNRRAIAKQTEGREAVLAEFEKGTRELQSDFPKEQEIYKMLLFLAQQYEGEKGKALAGEVVKSAQDNELIQMAQTLVKKLGLLGSKPDIAFTAVDGTEIDLADYRGKVVLIDFWATWCGPCVAELPNVLRAYHKLHDQGFEIIGISFDQSKVKLERFVKREKMPWPQYFDGQGWGNMFGREYGISSIPAMWLIDKNGVLRDNNARANLEQKVQGLLAEKTNI